MLIANLSSIFRSKYSLTALPSLRPPNLSQLIDGLAQSTALSLASRSEYVLKTIFFLLFAPLADEDLQYITISNAAKCAQ